MTTYESIGFIVVWNTNKSNLKIFYITFIHSFDMISISMDIFKTEQISFGLARI